jgi:predicted secreted protein
MKMMNLQSSSGRVMTTTYFLAMAAFLLAAALHPENATAADDRQPGSNRMQVLATIEDDHKQVTVLNGGILHLRLRAVAGAGYGWQVLANDKLFLVPVGDPYFETNKNTLPGGEQLEEFSFRAGRAGESSLRLGYARPWEKREPQKFFDLRVIILQP